MDVPRYVGLLSSILNGLRDPTGPVWLPLSQGLWPGCHPHRTPCLEQLMRKSSKRGWAAQEKGLECKETIGEYLPQSQGSEKTGSKRSLALLLHSSGETTVLRRRRHTANPSSARHTL